MAKKNIKNKKDETIDKKNTENINEIQVPQNNGDEIIIEDNVNKQFREEKMTFDNMPLSMLLEFNEAINILIKDYTQLAEINNGYDNEKYLMYLKKIKTIVAYKNNVNNEIEQRILDIKC